MRARVCNVQNKLRSSLGEKEKAIEEIEQSRGEEELVQRRVAHLSHIDWGRWEGQPYKVEIHPLLMSALGL